MMRPLIVVGSSVLSRVVALTVAGILLLAGPTTAQLINTPTMVLGAQPVTEVAVSPDGTLLVAVSDSSLVRLFDAATGEQILLFGEDFTKWRSVVWSPDGSTIVTGGREQSTPRVTEWDPDTGEMLRWVETTEGNDWINDLAFSSDGSFLVAAGDSGSSWGVVVLIDPVAWTVDEEYVIDENAVAVDVSPDGGSILVGTPFDARILSTSTGAELRTFTDNCADVAYSPLGDKVALGGPDGVKLYDPATGTELVTLAFFHPAESVEFSPDAAYVAVGAPADGAHDDGTMIFDAVTGSPLWSAKDMQPYFGDEYSVHSVTFFDAGARLAVGTSTSFTEGTAGFERATTAVRVFDTAAAMPTAVFTGGHTESIGCADYSGDDSLLVTGADDDTAVIWNATTGALLHTLTGHTASLSSVAFAATGNWVITGSYDDTAKVWNASTGGLIHTLTGHTDDVRGATLSPDGSMALTGSRDNTAKVWELGGGTVHRTLNIGFWGNGVDWHPTADEVVVAGGGELSFWNPITGAFLRSFPSESAQNVAYSADGSQVVAGSSSTLYAALFDAATGTELRRFPSTAATYGVDFSGDGSRVATGSLDNNARVFDAATGALITRFGHVDTVHAVAMSSTGSRLFTGVYLTGKTYVADRPDPEIVTDERESNLYIFEGTIDLSADGSRALTGTQTRAFLWDTATGEALQSYVGHADDLMSVAFTPDAAKVVTGDWGGIAKLWDAISGTEIHTFTGHTGEVDSVAISPDGATVATGSWDSTVRIWDAITGVAGPVLTDHIDHVRHVAFNRDGSRLLSVSRDSTVKVWDASTWTPIRSYSNTYAFGSAAFAADGRRVLTQKLDSRYRIVEWDPDTNAELTLFTIEGGLRPAVSMAYAPDNRYGYIGLDYPGTVRVYELATGTLVGEYSGHFSEVTSIALPYNGPVFLTSDGSGGDHMALLWETGWLFADGFESGDTLPWSVSVP